MARSVLNLFDLRDLGRDRYRADSPDDNHVRTFGGLTVAQALAAATKTVEDERPVNSLHSYFLRPGRPGQETIYSVERIRDGRSFSIRKVDAHQQDRHIFSLTASFHSVESGYEHSEPMPSVPGPDALVPFQERFAGRSDMGRWFERAQFFDIRYIDRTPFEEPKQPPLHHQQVWFRATEPNAIDQSSHALVVAYASDMTVLDPALLAHGIKWTDRTILGASLDHAIWFHGAFRPDEWLLFHQTSPVARGGRGLVNGEVWTQNGRLVVSFVQEALLRPPGTDSKISVGQQESL